MKKHIYETSLFLLGIIFLVSFKIIGSKITIDGILIEQFWMVPIGYFLILVSFIIIIIKKNKKHEK